MRICRNIKMSPRAANFSSNYGRLRGRRDMERIGLFDEGLYLIGSPWKPPLEVPERGGLGMQMIANGLKMKTGLQDCYFDKTRFKSLAEKDPYVSAYKLGRRHSLAEAKKRRTPQFWPPGDTKKSSTPGDFYGTFSGRIDAMSPEVRKTSAKKAELPNVKTNPSKKGTYGYPDITINKFPAYKEEGPEPSFIRGSGDKQMRGPFYVNLGPRAYFDDNPCRPAGPSGSLYVKRRKAGSMDSKKNDGRHWYPPHTPKWPANNHDGCFSDFPKHMPDPYGGKLRKTPSSSKSSAIFYPPIRGCVIRTYQESVVNLNVDFRISHKNWRFAKPFTFKDEPVIQTD